MANIKKVELKENEINNTANNIDFIDDIVDAEELDLSNSITKEEVLSNIDNNFMTNRKFTNTFNQELYERVNQELNNFTYSNGGDKNESK